MIVEVVAQSVEDAIAAQTSGAHRLELVSALSLGGLTPSIGTYRAVKRASSLPIVAMLRPRSGGFAYSKGELDAMEADGRQFIEEGSQGLVFGVLDQEGRIDTAANRRMVSLGGEAVFHRAFDALQSPREGLERLIDLGFRRILTSGGPGTAEEGVDRIAQLVDWASGRIEILPGGGVRPSNAARIAKTTKAGQLHLAGLHWIEDPSTRNADLVFNGEGHPESQFAQVDPEVIAALISAASR